MEYLKAKGYRIKEVNNCNIEVISELGNPSEYTWKEIKTLWTNYVFDNEKEDADEEALCNIVNLIEEDLRTIDFNLIQNN